MAINTRIIPSDKINELKLIISGCPASGTLFTAANLRQVYGFCASHERWMYDEPTQKWVTFETRDNERTEIDVAAANLTQRLTVDPLPSLPLIHLVRHPVKVFNSWCAIGHGARGDSWDGYENAASRLLRFTTECLEHKNIVYRHRIEDPFSELVDAIRRTGLEPNCGPPSLLKLTEPLNPHNKGLHSYTVEDILKLKDGDRYLSTFREYGYEV